MTVLQKTLYTLYFISGLIFIYLLYTSNPSIYSLMMLIGFFLLFVIHPIIYRLERNYINKYRKDIGQLLFGDSEDLSKPVDWAQHMMILASVGQAYLFSKYEKFAQKKGNQKNYLYPNLMHNKNYKKFYENNKVLFHFVSIDVIVFLVMVSCIIIAKYVIGTPATS